jgi:tetratricopeptide (TPR) repeat protein
MGTGFLPEKIRMWATLGLAALLMAQQPATLDALMARHTEASRKAKTFDELAGLARKTLADLLKFLESKPDAESAARARAIAADICTDLEDYDGAEAHLKAFLDAWPKHEQIPHIKMTQGQIRAAAGRDAGAREAFQSLVQDYPKDPRVFDARLRIAQSFLCERRDDDASKAFTDLRASFKGKTEEWAAVLQHAQALQVMGKPGDGRALLEEVVRTSSDPRAVDYAKQVLASWLWIGKPARPVEGWDLKEAPLKLDLAGNRVTVLYFMGTAFPAFPVEAGMMRRLARNFPPADLAVMAVAIDKDKPKLEADLALAGVTWPVFYDGNGFKGPIASNYGIDTLPMVFVIDRKNVVRYVNPVSGDHAREIARCVERLVAEK